MSNEHVHNEAKTLLCTLVEMDEDTTSYNSKITMNKLL